MLSITKAIATALALALSTAAAAGDVTYFKPGLGACGKNNGDGDFIVAVSIGLYDREHLCGHRLLAHYGGRSDDVTGVDRYGGCADGDIDLSPAAFTALIGSLGPGRVHGNWEWI